MLTTAVRRSWAPLGSTQVQLVWRLIGWSMLLSALRARGDHPLAIDGSVIPWPLHATAGAALLLLIFGPRLPILLATSAAWIWLQTHVLRGEDPAFDFIADEYLLFTALPVLGTLSAAFLLLAGAAPDELRRGQLWHLRMATIVALTFACLHKINVDFLAPATSCATLLGQRLAERWVLPGGPPAPLTIVLLEGLAPCLLLLYPRLGALWLLVLAAGLGHVGPYAFNALLAALALAFLPEHLRWRPPGARAWASLVIAALGVGLTSAQLFRGSVAWWPYLLLELTLVLVAWLVLRTTDPAPPPLWRPHRPRRPWLPGGHAHRSLCVYAALFMLLHGLSPYLGLKYRLSFAMLSNLRVDDDRWNSLIFPRALHLPTTDSLVHLHTLRTLKGEPMRASPKDRDALRPGAYSPQEFRRRYELARTRGRAATLALRYRGVEHQFGDLRFDAALQNFAASLPRQPLLQNTLSGPARQFCVH